MDNDTAALTAAFFKLRTAEWQVEQEVHAARDRGVTWEAIGLALGLSKQGAQQRYAR